MTEEKPTDTQLEQMRSMFSKFDKNGDGNINRDELKTAFATIGHNFIRLSQDDTAITSIMASSDTDGNGLINFEEFVKMMGQKSLF